MRFAGKKVLITGAASGIGRATALRFAAEGAELTIGDIDQRGLDETAAAIARPVRVHRYDASDTPSCQTLVAAAARDGLNVLCNIGGMLDWGPTIDFDEARFERVLRVNLFSVFALCRAALPHLVKSRGSIVNMASTAGLSGIPYSLAYAASKHGVVAITKSLAVEFAARGVRVNAVCPGQVNTNMGNAAPPAGDIDWSLMMRHAPKLDGGAAEPEDIAATVAFLASDEARKISGATLAVDGAQLAG
ncbi:MAG: SDR family NAD(P)-dependent oxidoreductase [Candidatus Sphingomonas colombiensis]|nr:SDR family NAD(P)-dependent oxidoreductase [Sphingomonas sp.]WEK42037.1 MAG: SDR family NAD(P)-dependent oxidoreductase [Sphingomonas sp.]